MKERHQTCVLYFTLLSPVTTSSFFPLPWLHCWIRHGLSPCHPFLHLIAFSLPLCICLLGQEEETPYTVLPVMAVTLWPKPSVKQAAIWTLRTERERHPSWEPLPGATKTLWSAWLNMEPTLMPLIRYFVSECIILTEKWSEGLEEPQDSLTSLPKIINLNAANCNYSFSALLQRFCELF